ncbi:MAG: DUF4105 domain-containing protein [Candidatus Falkowbacteria bacterium]
MEIILIIITTPVVFYTLILIFTKPSNNKNWTEDQKILPYAKINDNLVSIYNIRNFKYESEYVYTKNYYDKTFDLNKIKSVDFVLTPFSNFPGVAHTFLSFGFEGDEYVVISIEIRKKIGEEYSPLKGLFNKYEIMYVVADERDVIKLRTNHRKNNVYVYPIKAKKEKKQALFLNMLNEVNELKDNPKFYNTITTSCSINIMKHVNSISSKKIPFSYKIIMPEYSDKLAFDLGLIDTDLSLEEARKTFLISEKARKCSENENFSKIIRM